VQRGQHPSSAAEKQRDRPPPAGGSPACRDTR